MTTYLSGCLTGFVLSAAAVLAWHRWRALRAARAARLRQEKVADYIRIQRQSLNGRQT